MCDILGQHASMRASSSPARGRALGVTFSAPDDRVSYAGESCSRTKAALGGRAAEELVFQDVTTGAELDLEQVTAIARRMVGRWGMSPRIGATVLPADDGRPFGVPDAAAHAAADRRRGATHRGRGHADVHVLLEENRDKLGTARPGVCQHEMLDEEDAYAAAGVAHATTQEDPRRETALAGS